MSLSGRFHRATHVAGVLVAGLLLCGPTMVGAQSAAPVKITKCSVLQYQPMRPAFRREYWFDAGFAGPYVPANSPYTDGIAISFVNTSSQVADRIVFGVDYRGDFQHIVDAGQFSPNVSIDHTFADVFSGYAYIGSRPNSCIVRAVRFRDGSTWRAAGAHRQAM